MSFMTGERWFFDTNILVYLFDAKAPDKRATARALWDRACREAVPILSTQVLQEFFATVTKTVKQGIPLPQAREAMLEFAGIADVALISVPLIEAATRRIEDSGFSFWDSLIIETAIESGARRLWSEDFQDGQTCGELVIVNPFKAKS
jgi:predicted nucleic acid-binding protein